MCGIEQQPGQQRQILLPDEILVDCDELTSQAHTAAHSSALANDGVPKHSLPDRPVDLPAIQLCRGDFRPAYQLGSRAASEPRSLKTWVNISLLEATLTVGLQSQHR
jgi:hypothetical protein